MGITKTEPFTDHQNRVADLAKAFAHPARVAILQLLADRKACVCGDLVDELPLAQATVSQHLKELKRMVSSKEALTHPAFVTALTNQFGTKHGLCWGRCSMRSCHRPTAANFFYPNQSYYYNKPINS